MTKIAVVALGGNALTRAGQSGSCDEMMANAAAMATAVNDVLTAGWRVVIVHGNGPQVGNLALQQEATSAVPAQPLALVGAMTQGMLGSLIARAIDLLRGRGTAATLVTHVTVDHHHPPAGLEHVVHRRGHGRRVGHHLVTAAGLARPGQGVAAERDDRDLGHRILGVQL